MLVIIHDLNLAAAYSDRIAVLQGGELAACGTPDEVLCEDLLSAVFECDLAVLRGHGLAHPLIVPRRGHRGPGREVALEQMTRDRPSVEQIEAGHTLAIDALSG